ncbi:SLATT domain-containing protein [Pseudaeromonas paramecii]|uniref:SLATT domain-containing protein n=1 Tax=Pseudaeromonas paramecii TaxID=2138166 RepID=A0ABP8Q9I1_9GAMM
MIKNKTDETPPNIDSKKGVPLYAQGSFDKQLNYNLWSTSRTRYIAARRLRSKDARSSKAIAFLSAYMIIFTLSDYLFLSHLKGYNGSYILFLNVTFSLLILIFSQLESSASYGVRAVKFHECGLEISRLYKMLRRLKSRYEGHEKDDAFYKQVEAIDDEYDQVLKNYENHELMDFELFKSNYPNYEDHKLNWIGVFNIQKKHYLKDVAIYHLVTYVPLAAFVYIVIKIISGAEA